MGQRGGRTRLKSPTRQSRATAAQSHGDGAQPVPTVCSRPDVPDEGEGRGARRLGARERRLVRELVAEVCRERGSRVGGLTPAEAGVLSDLLLRCYGQSPEYPFWATVRPQGSPSDRLRSHSRATACTRTESAAQALAQWRETAGAEHESAEPLLRILYVLVKIGAISAGAAADLGEHLTPVPTHPARGSPGQPPAYLLPVISGLLVAANLTERQGEIARRLLCGASNARVARELAIAPATVRVIWGQARRRLRVALVQMVLDRAERERARHISRAQVEQVVRHEQARVGYQRPRHCPPGKERCAECGFCPFALVRQRLEAGR
jgi:DNA-binding CsgD family transcriptional regulator